MEYGKFNSAEELLKGYAELEKSFTQKCQQLSELQKQMATANQENPLGTNGQPSPSDVTQSTADDGVTVPTPNGADSNSEVSPSVTVTPPKVMTVGGNVSMALPTRPKTLREASELAQKYFK